MVAPMPSDGGPCTSVCQARKGDCTVCKRVCDAVQCRLQGGARASVMHAMSTAWVRNRVCDAVQCRLHGVQPRLRCSAMSTAWVCNRVCDAVQCRLHGVQPRLRCSAMSTACLAIPPGPLCSPLRDAVQSPVRGCAEARDREPVDTKITERDSRTPRKTERRAAKPPRRPKKQESRSPLDSLGAFAAWRPLSLVFDDRDR